MRTARRPPTEAQIVYETDTGKLFYDADGEGGKKAVQFAVLEGKPEAHLLGLRDHLALPGHFEWA